MPVQYSFAMKQLERLLTPPAHAQRVNYKESTEHVYYSMCNNRTYNNKLMDMVIMSANLELRCMTPAVVLMEVTWPTVNAFWTHVWVVL